MAGEPELDNALDEIPEGLTTLDLHGVGYMNDKFTKNLAAAIKTEEVAIQWNFDCAWREETEGMDNFSKDPSEDEKQEYGSAVSRMANVVSLTVKMNRYGRYAFAGLTLDPHDDYTLPHGFGVKMSPIGLSRASGGLFEKNKFLPVEDQICISLRCGQVEVLRNGKVVEVLGQAPPDCVSMYGKIFMREPDLRLNLLTFATCSQVSSIDLSHNKIEDAGAESIAECVEKDTTLVRVLNLSVNRISDTGAVRLCKALQSGNCRVTDLNLSHNSIGDEGAHALAVSLEKECCRVVTMDLTDNDIGDSGSVRLAGAFKKESCSVTDVRLALNRIESAGFIAIAEALEKQTCKVSNITLGQNRPEPAAKKRLAQAYAKTLRLNVA